MYEVVMFGMIVYEINVASGRALYWNRQIFPWWKNIIISSFHVIHCLLPCQPVHAMWMHTRRQRVNLHVIHASVSNSYTCQSPIHTRVDLSNTPVSYRTTIETVQWRGHNRHGCNPICDKKKPNHHCPLFVTLHRWRKHFRHNFVTADGSKTFCPLTVTKVSCLRWRLF